MRGVIYAAAGTGFTLLMTALGAAVVFLMKKGREGRGKRACLGFAAGVMLAATVWSLLLPALERGGLPVALTGFALGAGSLMGLESALMRRLRRRSMGIGRGTALLFAAVTLHNIPEGMAVGLSCALAAQSGEGAALLAAAALSLGVGLQNLPEGAALSLPLHSDGLSRGRAFACGAASAVVEPVFGILAALAVGMSQPLLPYLLAAAAGAMLPVTVRELIPQACGEDDGGTGTLAVLAGFALMMGLDIALG